MSQLILKNIDITLDPASFQRAINAVYDLRDGLQSAMTHLIETLTEKGVEIAKAELIMFWNPAYDSGALSESIQAAMLNEHEGIITTGVTYAVFVEYGTGAVGSVQSHPEPNGYQYDTKGHGLDGWVYRSTSDGKFHWTAGMASRPFMYNTLRDLEAEAEAIGGKVIAEYIP